MKKVLLIISIILIAIFVLFVTSCLLAFSFGPTNNFAYDIGRWCATPFVILIAIGVSLLCRSALNKAICKTEKKFAIGTPIVFIVLGMFWGCVRIITSIAMQSTYDTISRSFYDHGESHHTQLGNAVFITMDDAGISTFHADSCCKAINKSELYQTTTYEIAVECGYHECATCATTKTSEK